MSTATLNVEQAAEFWRVARRLHSIYAELDANFELGVPPCAELESAADRSEPDTMERVREWFEQMDSHIQVWQLRQLLQSTSLQTEENLRYMIVRHLERAQKSEADKDKLDFLLVQYFAHCAPPGINEQQLTLDEVARVLEPVLGTPPQKYPDWAGSLDEKLKRLNACNSLEELQNTGALLEVRELKANVGDQYFEPGLLVAFTRFNFRARRAFFKAMHLDLHAIREAVNELERLGCSNIDCREAGLTENESLEQVRHVVHQWKTPFRAPYSGGSSFLQLVVLRLILDRAVKDARAAAVTRPLPHGSSDVAKPAPQHINRIAENMQQGTARVTAQKSDGNKQPEPVGRPAIVKKAPPPEPGQAFETVVQPPSQAPAAVEAKRAESDPLLMRIGEHSAAPAQATPSPPVARPLVVASTPQSSAGEASSEHEDYLQRCMADITEQLSAAAPRHSPAVCAITLGGCKLLIATWEADAFVNANNDFALALQRAVAARTILHVCMERHRKGEPTDLTVALDLARGQAPMMEKQVVSAKESNNIDAAVNLAATAKRLLALIDEAEKVPVDK